MIFNSVGNKNNPIILMLHPELLNSNFFDEIIKVLSTEYYILLPILDGHDKSTTFNSINKQAEKIIFYLKSKDLDKIELVLGVSLGGVIGLELLNNKTISIKNLFLDGAPFYDNNSILKKAFSNNIYKSYNGIKNSSSKEMLHLSKLYGKKNAKLMSDVTVNMNKMSIDNIVDEIFDYKIPVLTEKEKSKIVYFYGSKEFPRFAVNKIKEYKNNRIIVMKGIGHCEYISQNPIKYALFLKEIIGS